jgi:citronellol/citronellal dehydrogenase
MSLMKGKTILITGAGQGIGLAIALRFAAAGANIAMATKDSPAAIQQAADQIVDAGGLVLALNVDVCDHSAMQQAVAEAVACFGGIDVLVNNTSATIFTDILHTPPEKFDALISTGMRAAFLMSRACIPHLQQAQNPHIINISPPINLDPQWFKNHLAFSLSKYGMSLCTLGMSAEFQQKGIAVNSLWPQTTIATQTIKDHFSPQVYTGSRWPSIMADAAYQLVQRPAQTCTGHFFTDEAILKESGVDNFSHYAVAPDAPLMQALFVPLESDRTVVSQDLFLSAQR